MADVTATQAKAVHAARLSRLVSVLKRTFRIPVNGTISATIAPSLDIASFQDQMIASTQSYPNPDVVQWLFSEIDDHPYSTRKFMLYLLDDDDDPFASLPREEQEAIHFASACMVISDKWQSIRNDLGTVLGSWLDPLPQLRRLRYNSKNALKSSLAAGRFFLGPEDEHADKPTWRTLLLGTKRSYTIAIMKDSIAFSPDTKTPAAIASRAEMLVLTLLLTERCNEVAAHGDDDDDDDDDDEAEAAAQDSDGYVRSLIINFTASHLRIVEACIDANGAVQVIVHMHKPSCLDSDDHTPVSPAILSPTDETWCGLLCWFLGGGKAMSELARRRQRSALHQPLSTPKTTANTTTTTSTSTSTSMPPTPLRPKSQTSQSHPSPQQNLKRGVSSPREGKENQPQHRGL